MTKLSPLLLLAMLVAVTLGLPLGLYALLTRKRRAVTQEIRERSAERGWKFRTRHWTGDPSSVRLEGRSRSGLAMVVKTGGTHGYDPGWNATLSVRFPELAGEADVTILPRRIGRDSGVKIRGVSAEVQAKVAAYSGLAASVLHLLSDGRETPSGFADFDKAYQVLSLGVSWQPLVDARIAQKALSWPEDVVALHTIVAWRDPFGFHLEARLPAPANWATICYVVSLAEDLSARLPAGKMVAAPKGIVDELITGILGRR